MMNHWFCVLGNPDRKHKLWNIVSTGRYIFYAGVAGMLLQINGEFKIGKFCSFVVKFRSQPDTVSIFRRRSMYAAFLVEDWYTDKVTRYIQTQN